MEKNFQYILASASPRRIEIMQSHGIAPLVLPAHIDENIPPKHDMCETVMFLAFKKAKWAEAAYLKQASVLNPADAKTKAVVIAADTIVYQDEIMGKPENPEDGFRMLCKLRGGMHYVVTGVALIAAGMQNARVFAEVTKVFFKDYTDEELRAYLATEEPYDKAGGYAIQGSFAKYVDHIEGDYSNVVGFPWDRIQTELKKL